MLDLELYDLPSIAEAVVQNMVITDQLSLTHYTKVIAALLLKHKHQYQSRQPVLRRLSNVNDFQKLQTGSTTSLDQIPDQIHETPIDVKDAQGNDDSDADDGMIQLRIDRDNDVSVRFSPASHCIDDNTDSQVSTLKLYINLYLKVILHTVKFSNHNDHLSCLIRSVS